MRLKRRIATGEQWAGRHRRKTQLVAEDGGEGANEIKKKMEEKVEEGGEIESKSYEKERAMGAKEKKRSKRRGPRVWRYVREGNYDGEAP